MGSAAVFGATAYGADCPADRRAFLDEVRLMQRAALASRAFEQCVDRSMRLGLGLNQRYGACYGDPLYGQPIDVQRRAVIDAARTMNDVGISCTGGFANASAAISVYDHWFTESLSFSGWLESVFGQLSMPVCSSGAPAPCRLLPYPWPYSQVAGVISHELMHQHGYVHGSNDDNAAARVSCRVPASDTSWHFQHSTVPYQVGNCVDYIAATSGIVCPKSCGVGRVQVITGIGASGCECVDDPARLSVRSANAFVHRATSANITGARTVLDHPTLNNRPSAVVHFTHAYNPPGGAWMYDGNRTIARYDAALARWVLEHGNGAPMPNGVSYFVRVGRGVVHTTSSANVAAHMTTVDHFLGDGDPTALVTVSRGAGATSDDAIGVWYDGRKWRIFHEQYATMETAARFAVDVETSANRGLHFVHVAASSNTFANYTILRSPHLDGRPDAKLLVTRDYTRGAVRDSSDLGVFYNGTNWAIYQERGGAAASAMPIGSAFVVEVLRDEAQRWVKVAEASVVTDTLLDVTETDLVFARATGLVYTGPPQNAGVPPTGLAPGGAGFPFAGNRYALIGRFASAPYQLFGREWTNRGNRGRLELRVNDDIPNNGAGFYGVELRAFR